MISSVEKNLRRKIFVAAYKLFDLVNACACMALSAYAVNPTINMIPPTGIFHLEASIQTFIFFLAALFTCRITFIAFGFYKSQRLRSRTRLAIGIFSATFIAALAIFIEGRILGIEVLTVDFLAVFWCLISTSTVLSRIILIYILGKIRSRGRNLRFFMVIGTNPRAIEFAKELIGSPKYGYRMLGFADNEWPGINNARDAGFDLACNFEELPNFIRNQVIDEVIIALPIKSLYNQALKIVKTCEDQGITVRYLSNIFNANRAHSKNGYLAKHLTTELNSGQVDVATILVKRGLDILFSSILLALLSPVFLITSLAIKITSPGPLFFAQERVGLNKRRFTIYKFRSMVPDADQKQAELENLNEASGPVFKIYNDPRITPVGRFIRKFSIDELPQLLNVLKGDMSLVGPRPLPVRDYLRFYNDSHRRRFSVRPGVTCLWQVNGRSSLSFDKWMELDMNYIDHWSLFLDFNILFKTIPAVIKGTGAK